MSSEHLGNTEELLHYLMEMNEQLDKHRKEKQPLRELDMFDLIQMLVPEIINRAKEIHQINRTMRHSKNSSLLQQEIKKQSVHIGNYAMMIFCKAREF